MSDLSERQPHHPSPGAFPARARNPREVLLFGLTPPRTATDPERVAEIAERTLTRVESLPIDALVLYDLTDESDRNPAPRPFPFVETLDPSDYLRDRLTRWDRPAVVYRCVSKYAPEELQRWLVEAPEDVMTVFVGTSSSDAPARTTLTQALDIHREVRPDLPRFPCRDVARYVLDREPVPVWATQDAAHRRDGRDVDADQIAGTGDHHAAQDDA